MFVAASIMEKKDALSYWFQQQEEGRAENLFQTHVIVHDRACMLTIDHMSFINAVSFEMVEKLELPTVPLEHNYLLRLGNIELNIAHQASVQFHLGPLSYAVCCDVIPINMVSCHLLLGIPWTKEQGAVYFLDNKYKYYKYIVTRGKTEYTLRSMNTVTYKAWREERLQKKEEAKAQMRELEEAKRREAEAAAQVLEPVQPMVVADSAAIFVAPIASTDHVVVDVPVIDIPSVHDVVAAEDGSKPRTVSPEGRENDMAPPKLDGAYFAIPYFAMSHATKRRIMFLFLPRKEKPKDVISKFLGTWCIMCLKESGWGPPSSVLMMVAHLQKSLSFFCVVLFLFTKKWV